LRFKGDQALENGLAGPKRAFWSSIGPGYQAHWINRLGRWGFVGDSVWVSCARAVRRGRDHAAS